MKFSKEKKYPLAILCIVLAAAASVCIWARMLPAEAQAKLPQNLLCLDTSAFDAAVGPLGILNGTYGTRPPNALNPDGTIRYFYDDFSSYASSTSVLSGFENLDGITADGGTLSESSLHINGDRSLTVDVSDAENGTSSSSDGTRTVKITVPFDSPFDLSRFENSGYITGWLRIADRADVESVSAELVDADGNTRAYQALPNMLMNEPNFYDRNDAYPDIPFRYQADSSDEWTDFWLASGWNYVFWMNDPSYYRDSGPFDLSRVRSFVIEVSAKPGTAFDLDDFRFISGLQKQDNPLSPNWYPPNGNPQYGVYDVDRASDGETSVKLLNVRQTQYLSNGDHGRMLTSGGTPIDFALRTRFTLEDLGAEGGLNNTWLRIMYDFDPSYDPGHDWFGFYDSFQWDQSGLLTVIPIQRFYLQTQEPLADDISLSSKNFSIQAGDEYEVDLVVRGQTAEASIYEVGDGCLRLVSHMSYTFNRARHANARYPFGVEITGNAKARIYSFEVADLDQNNQSK